jgi:hypothetical protein
MHTETHVGLRNKKRKNFIKCNHQNKIFCVLFRPPIAVMRLLREGWNGNCSSQLRVLVIMFWNISVCIVALRA